MNKKYFFHPFEIAFCGYSNSGKTTLITNLIRGLSSRYKVGYIKHDVHAFTMDREGKDTYRAKASGAHSTLISDPRHFAHIQSGKVDDKAHQLLHLDSDFIFIEGYKGSQAPKIILIDESEEILADFDKHRFKNIIAFAGAKDFCRDLPVSRPYFQRDDLKGIQQCLLDHLENQVKAIPLYGLVLAGGRSVRMKKDKSLLKYHGKTQVEHCFELLTPLCEKVFVSNREEQAELNGHAALPQINDTFLNIGPLGGILSAMTTYREAALKDGPAQQGGSALKDSPAQQGGPALKDSPAQQGGPAWLVLACDLPYANESTLQNLIVKRNPFKVATVYQSTHDQLPEPLCAIYEPKILPRLLAFLADGRTCPRKILLNSDITLLEPIDRLALDNVNNPEECQKAVESLTR